MGTEQALSASERLDRVAWGFMLLTVALGGALLFLIQPMVARSLLPRVGGSPTLWVTCVVFFQLSLLLGYGAAHLGARLRRDVRTASIATVAIAVALLTPFTLPTLLHDAPFTISAASIVRILAVSVGAGTVLLAASSSLIQYLGNANPVAQSKGVYALYGLSNIGCLGGLLAYPFLIEPTLALGEQLRWWALAFAAWTLLFLGVLATLKRRNNSAWERPTDVDMEPAGGREVARWFLLPFSSNLLLLALTTFITIDIAAIPLLWVAPLALFLLSFGLAFGPWPKAVLRSGTTALVPLALILPLLMTLTLVKPRRTIVLLAFHLGCFFVVTLGLHLKLQELKPRAGRLTEFYLWIGAAGVMAGVINLGMPTLVGLSWAVAEKLADWGYESPASLFTFLAVPEYALGLILSAWFLSAAATRGVRMAPFYVGIALATTLIFVDLRNPMARWTRLWDWVGSMGLPTYSLLDAAPTIAILIVAYCVARSRESLVLVLAIAVASAALTVPRGKALWTERNFFGLITVRCAPDGSHFQLLHGSTIHGAQSANCGDDVLPAAMTQSVSRPTTYYGTNGPVGQIFKHYPIGSTDSVAVMGLGVGTLAAYAGSAGHWKFFEIDPDMTKVATESGYFTFIAQARSRGAKIEIAHGDARMLLARETSSRYRLIVVDVFSSDAIPVHLITREALQLYRSRLATDGAIAFNLSSRYLNLEPVLATAARELGLTAIISHDRIDEGLDRYQSSWALVAEKSSNVGIAPTWQKLLTEQPGTDFRRGETAPPPSWDNMFAGSKARSWTDDYASVLLALKR